MCISEISKKLKSILHNKEFHIIPNWIHFENKAQLKIYPVDNLETIFSLKNDNIDIYIS